MIDTSFILGKSILTSHAPYRVFQERLIAPRILRYGFTELSWECWTQFVCECEPTDEDIRYDDSDPTNTHFRIKMDTQYRVKMLGKLALSQQHSAGLINSKEPLVEHLDNWYELVCHFTLLELTYHSDRLPALSGLAAKFHGASDEYICGLWRSDFANGLSWYVTADRHGGFRTSYRQEHYHAPSWSWASVTGNIGFDKKWPMDVENLAEILEIEYSLASSNPYGAVSHACITVRGFLLAIQLDADWGIHLDLGDLQDETSGQESRMSLGTFFRDIHAGQMAVHATIVQESLFLCVLQRNHEIFRSCAIVLRAMADALEPRTFQRIGYWETNDSTYLQNVIVDVICDTSERQVFKIV
jgi:hypothetical protein